MPPERSLGTTVAEQVFEALHRRADTRTTYSGVMDEVEARRRLRAERAEVDAALGRLAAGTYGRCVRCGGPIAADRLDARPSTPVCIGCAGSS